MKMQLFQQKRIIKKAKYILGFLLLGVFLLAFSGFALAQPDAMISPEVKVLEQKLADDEKHLLTARTELEKLRQEDKQPQEQQTEAKSISERELAKIRLRNETARVTVENVVLDLGAVNQSISNLETTIAEITKQLASLRSMKRTESEQSKIQELEQMLAEKQATLAFAQNRAPVLRQLLGVSEEISIIYEKRLIAAQKLLSSKQAENRETRQVELQVQLAEQQQAFQAQATRLREQLQALGPTDEEFSAQHIRLQDQLFEAEENIALTEMRLALTQISIRVANLSPIPEEGFYSPAKAREVENNIKNVLESLKEIVQRIDNKIALLQRLQNVTEQRDMLSLISKSQASEQQKIYEALLNGYQSEQMFASELVAHVLSYREQFKQAAAQGISVMQKLPTSFLEWKQLGEELQALPGLLFTELRYLSTATTEQVKSAHAFRWFVLVIVELTWLIGCYYASGMLKRMVEEQKPTEGKLLSFSGYAWRIVSRLIVRNGRILTLLGGVFLLLRILNVPRADVNLIIMLVLIGLLFKFALDIARYVLLENITDYQGMDVKLYRSLRWGIILGGTLTLVTALAHSLPIPAEATGFVDRLFMLVLLAVSFPLLKSAELLPNLLLPYREKHLYLYRAGRLLSFLAPLIVMSTAIIGLVGYVNLAWRIGMIEGQFLLVLIAWMIARGVIADTMDWLSDRLITEVRNGWVWSEAFLKPLHRIINLALLLSAVVILGMVYSQHSQVHVFAWVRETLYRPLFTVGEVSVALINIIAFLMFSSVVIWLAKWSREFAYRWLFARTTEPGLRNSLAAFTQYAAVAIGLLFILRLIGINLTTLTVVLASLGLGVGIALRDIFNNLASGVLLLIERPVRTGDYVRIGDYEGEVIHIGMRAITVKTPDNMEAMIPNALAVNTSFVNWTYNDAIIRLVSTVRIAFEEDIYRAQKIIEGVLKQHPDVVRDPAPQVLLQEFAESSVLFSVRFYINLKMNAAFAVIRSQILFSILESLKEAGISIPVPKREVITEKNLSHGERQLEQRESGDGEA